MRGVLVLSDYHPLNSECGAPDDHHEFNDGLV